MCSDVLTEAKARIAFAFNTLEKLYVSFSAGKDSTVMLHLVLDEAKRRNRTVGVLLIDLEAQYDHTIKHAETCFELYKDYIEPYWICLPMALRNAVSNFDPRWICWDENKKQDWVRQMPKECIKDLEYFPFFCKGMEFEEFMVEFGIWYSQGKPTGAFVGIRCDESLNRFRTIASRTKAKLHGKSFTTEVTDNLYNIYPVYDWNVSDLWHYHAENLALPYNKIYDYMYKAGLTPSEMRLCQPYGDDQRKGLWLFHILEPQTWYKVIARVNGANTGALYVGETGNAAGYGKITKPADHTWKSFCNLLLSSLPKNTQEHYREKFLVFIRWWKKRGYPEGLPDEAPPVLEAKRLAPSWRRLCKVLLRNDYWCKGLAFSQPRSAVYGEYLKLKKGLKTRWDEHDR
jgi:predicted phosphoadenosine phosphosulfate sulfurtransferase